MTRPHRAPVAQNGILVPENPKSVTSRSVTWRCSTFCLDFYKSDVLWCIGGPQEVGPIPVDILPLISSGALRWQEWGQSGGVSQASREVPQGRHREVERSWSRGQRGGFQICMLGAQSLTRHSLIKDRPLGVLPTTLSVK